MKSDSFHPFCNGRQLEGNTTGWAKIINKKRVFRFSSNFGFRVQSLSGKMIDPRNSRPGNTGGEIIDLGGEIISDRGIFSNIRWRRNNRPGCTWIGLPTCPTIPSRSYSNLISRCPTIPAAYQHP